MSLLCGACFVGFHSPGRPHDVCACACHTADTTPFTATDLAEIETRTADLLSKMGTSPEGGRE